MMFHRNRAGAVLIIAAAWTAILAAIAAAALGIIQRHHRHAYQIASWHAALGAAESGVDMAVTELRKSLRGGTSWVGWTQTTGPSGATYTSNVMLRPGEAGQRAWVVVQVDAPPGLLSPTGDQWYRVRSFGYAEVPGGAVATGEDVDRKLRKIDFRVDRLTGASVADPRAFRVVEAIVKPIGAFRVAMLGGTSLDLSNLDVAVDSYDSMDPDKSTDGYYDPAKRQKHGDIATNGVTLDAANAHIFGSAATNGGEVLNASNVTGEIQNDFYQELLPVMRPTMVAEPGSPTTVRDNTTLTAKAGAPAQFILSDIHLNYDQVLHIKGAGDGSDTYAQIVVNGNLRIRGNSQIVIDPGVHVRVFVAGNATLTGRGVSNPGAPINFQFYGMDRPPGEPPGSLQIADTGSFRGAVYAPNYDIQLTGGDSADSFFGGFVGRSVRLSNVQTLHYDEALATAGLISDYRVVSWMEQVR